MSVLTRTTAVGVFQTPVQADDAIDALIDARFARGTIGVLSLDNDYYRQMRQKVGTSASSSDTEGASTGAVTGAVAGAGIGGLIGLGVLAGVVPVIGPAIAAGTLGTIISNAALGAGVAGLAGALMGSGIEEDEATFYEGEVKRGHVVVTVNAGDRFAEAQALLNKHGSLPTEHSMTPQVVA